MARTPTRAAAAWQAPATGDDRDPFQRTTPQRFAFTGFMPSNYSAVVYSFCMQSGPRSRTWHDLARALGLAWGVPEHQPSCATVSCGYSRTVPYGISADTHTHTEACPKHPLHTARRRPPPPRPASAVRSQPHITTCTSRIPVPFQWCLVRIAVQSPPQSRRSQPPPQRAPPRVQL